MNCKAENWHAVLYRQYFLKHRFSDIYCCTFNISRRLVSVHIIGDQNLKSELEWCIQSIKTKLR